MRGNSLSSLGEQENGAQRLEEAVAVYEAALKIFEAADAPHYIEIAKNNLANAQAMLQEYHSEAGPWSH